MALGAPPGFAPGDGGGWGVGRLHYNPRPSLGRALGWGQGSTTDQSLHESEKINNFSRYKIESISDSLVSQSSVSINL